MASAQKLASGAWRTRARKVINGKMVTKSFTVSPSECRGDWKKAKTLSESRAREWVLSARDDENNYTVGKAIDNYIKDREAVLSPSSITSYQQYVQYFEKIKDICIEDLDSGMIQELINDMSVSVGAKTIKSRIGFLFSVLNYAECDKKFRIRYPQRIPKAQNTPDHNEIRMLLTNADEIIALPIALAAFGTLRRGEIAALKAKDVSKDLCTIYVRGNMVRKGNTFVYKSVPKTSDSYRSVRLPKIIIERISLPEDPEAFIFDLSPTAITRRFERLRDSLGLKCTFHDLRHFAASWRSDIGIPRKYIEEAGGWSKDSGVLADVYDNALASTRTKYVTIANKYIEDHFADVIRKKA